MGAFGAGSFFLGGQEQGRAANQIEQMKLDILKRQAAAQTRQIVQMPDGSYRVIDLADPNATGASFGASEDLGKELKALAPTIPTDLQPFVNAAIQSGDRRLQQSAYDVVTKRLGQKSAQVGGRDPVVLDQAMTDAGIDDPTKVTNAQYLDAWKKIQGYKSGLIAGRTPPTVAMIPGYDELGRPTASANLINRRAGTAAAVTTTTPPAAGSSAAATSGPVPLVGHKLTPAMSNELTAVNQAEDQIPGIEALYPTIAKKYAENGGAKWLLSQWGLYNKKWNPGGIFGRVDPDAADWFTKVGQMKGLMLSAAGSNSRNLKMVNDLYGQHVVAETQDPVPLMQRIRSFQNNGRFDAVRQSLGVSTESDVPLAGSAPADDLSVKGYVKLPDGTWYNPTTNKYDDGK